MHIRYITIGYVTCERTDESVLVLRRELNFAMLDRHARDSMHVGHVYIGARRMALGLLNLVSMGG